MESLLESDLRQIGQTLLYAPLFGRDLDVYDVAMTAGVAQSTVSRCFQEDSAISPGTRAHVIAVAERLGYRPNAVARSLILGRSNAIGVIVNQYTLRNNPDLLYAVSNALTQHKLTLLLITVADNDEDHATIQGALEFPLDEVISCTTLSLEDIGRFRRFGVPVTLLNRQAAACGVAACRPTTTLRLEIWPMRCIARVIGAFFLSLRCGAARRARQRKPAGGLHATNRGTRRDARRKRFRGYRR